MSQLYIEGKPVHHIKDLFEKEGILAIKPNPHGHAIIRRYDSLELLDLELMAKLCGYEYSFNFHEHYAEWVKPQKRKG